jgi:hypothetical protein
MNLDPALPPSQIEPAIDQAWRRLPYEISRKQLESLFAPPLPPPLLDALLASERLAGRLADRVAARLGVARPGAADFEDPPARLALAGRKAVETAIRLAGALYHGRRLNRLVLRSARAEVSAGIGADAFAAALRHGEGEGDDDRLTADWTATELVTACTRDGPMVFSAWRAALPRSVGDWIATLAPVLGTLDVPSHPDPAAVRAASLAAAAALDSAHG